MAETAASKLRRGTDFFARYGGEEFVALILGGGSENDFAYLKKVRQAVEELPPPDREIFLLRYYLYQPVKEIARRLGMTPKAVEHRLDRGRRRLREKLMERGVDL